LYLANIPGAWQHFLLLLLLCCCCVAVAFAAMPQQHAAHKNVLIYVHILPGQAIQVASCESRRQSQLL